MNFSDSSILTLELHKNINYIFNLINGLNWWDNYDLLCFTNMVGV